MTAIKTYPVVVPTTLGNLQTVNFYIVEMKGQLLLMDAGNDDDQSWDALHQVLQQMGATADDLSAILLTHNHTDHIGLVNRIRRTKQAIAVYAPEKALPRIKRDRSFLEKRYAYYEQLFAEAGCGSDADERLHQLRKVTFTEQVPMIDGPMIPIRPGDDVFSFQVIDSAGHSPDHVLFYHEGSKVAFVGDHFLAHSPSNAIVDIENDGSVFHSLIRYEQSLKNALELDIQTAYAGHGAVMTDVHQVIENKLKRIQAKSERILQCLTEAKSAARIAKELYKDRYRHPQLFSLIMSEIIGHIDRLAHLGVIEREPVDGVYYIKRK